MGMLCKYTDQECGIYRKAIVNVRKKSWQTQQKKFLVQKKLKSTLFCNTNDNFYIYSILYVLYATKNLNLFLVLLNFQFHSRSSTLPLFKVHNRFSFKDWFYSSCLAVQCRLQPVHKQRQQKKKKSFSKRRKKKKPYGFTKIINYSFKSHEPQFVSLLSLLCFSSSSPSNVQAAKKT